MKNYKKVKSRKLKEFEQSYLKAKFEIQDSNLIHPVIGLRFQFFLSFLKSKFRENV